MGGQGLDTDRADVPSKMVRVWQSCGSEEGRESGQSQPTLRLDQSFTLGFQVNPDPLGPLSHFPTGGPRFSFDAMGALDPVDSARERVNVLPYARGSYHPLQ